MRWDAQRLDRDEPDVLPGLPTVRGLLRTVQVPEFPGVTFHEVRCRTALNAVPSASAMPFRFTVNTFRGCSHACVYCFARGSHEWLELDAGRDFDTQVVVKTNVVEVLHKELSRPSWRREHVALGTNTDPYQRAEGRYRLMPGVIRALAASGTPLSILTKGTLLRRDLPLLAAASADVPVGLGVSLALLDPALHASLEPGTPGPRARLDLVRAISGAGLPCGVFLAPVLPWISDGVEQLDAVLAELADAGATGVTVLPLHLRPGAREWFLAWLGRERPDLVPLYTQLYGRGAYVPGHYRRLLADRVAPLLRRHGLDSTASGQARGLAQDEGQFPAGSLPAQLSEVQPARVQPGAGSTRAAQPADRQTARPAEQLTLC